MTQNPEGQSPQDPIEAGTSADTDVPAPADPHTTVAADRVEEGDPVETQDVSAAESEVAHEDAPVDPADPVAVAEAALSERTLDLQRLQAEYANYRKRVDRDRQLVAENATYAALTPIIEVLDTIDRARESATSMGGELEGGFQAVADQLERVVAAQGLVRFGLPGDAFDPTVHEALSHIGEDAEVEVTTCKVIAKAGYKIGDRVVRAAQVLVVDPAA